VKKKELTEKDALRFIKTSAQAARGVMLKTAEDIGGKEYKDKMKLALKKLKFKVVTIAH